MNFKIKIAIFCVLFLGHTSPCLYSQTCQTGVVAATANTAEDSVSVCTGDAVQLVLSAAGAGFCSGSWEYLWFDGSLYYDGAGFNSPTEVWHSSYSTVILSSVTQTSTYKGKIRCSTDFACTDSSVVKIIVNPVPVCDQKADIEVCCGGLVDIGDFVGTPTGTTFTWTNTNVSIGLASYGTGNILSFYSSPNCTGLNVTGTITVTPSYNGCPGPAMSFDVTVKSPATINQKPNVSVCPGAPINIGNFTSTPSGASFTWTNSNTAIGLAASGTGNIMQWNAPSNSTCSNITSTITVTPTLNGCPGYPMSFAVTIYPTPQINQMPNIAVCPGQLVNVGYPTGCPAGYTYSWTNTNPNIGIPASGMWTPSWTAPANNTGSNIVGTITITPSINGCPGPPMSFTVTIYPEPGTPPLVIGSATSNEGTTNTYTVNAVPGATSYIWTVPGGWTIVSGQGTNSISVITGPAGQNGDIGVSAVNLCDTSAAYLFPVTSVLGTTSVISGIINTYYPVTAYCACHNSVTLSSCTGLSVGDKVLLIQMKGAAIDSSNTPSSGSISDYKNAGNYDLALIDSISGCEVFLRDSLHNSYSPEGVVQLVKIPQYNDVVVDDTLTCLKWNGAIGGVLIFEAQGSVTLNAPVDVSGKGFAGGAAFTCDADYQNTSPLYTMPSYLGNKVKGEGISTLPTSLIGGRGTQGNGGGAAGAQPALNGMTDALFNGGGGGGNYGAGGNGGKSSTFFTTQYTGGLGGRAMNYSNLAYKIFMGGGGGAGHRKYTTTGPTNGTDGGGMAIIKAHTLSGNNYAVLAEGIDNQTVPNNTGRGGGGAGGTVLLDVQNYTGHLNVSAKGGHGGDNAGGNRTGPGGGGGGGVVWINQSTLPSNITCNVNGGTSGLQMTYTDPWGATDGAQGAVLNNLMLPEGQSLFVPFTTTTTIGSNSPVCEGDTLLLTADMVSGIDSFLWVGPNGFVSYSQNPQIPNATTANAGVYSLYLIDNGCPGPAVTLTAVVHTAPVVYAGPDLVVTVGTSILLNASVTGGSGSYMYQWEPAMLVADPHADSTTTVPLNNIVSFILFVTDSVSLCSNSDTLCAIVMCSSTPINAMATQDTICSGDTVSLSITSPCSYNYDYYYWTSDPPGFYSSIVNPIVTPSVTTTYIATGINYYDTVTSSVVVTVISSLTQYPISTDIMCLSDTTATISTGGSDTGVYYQLYLNNNPFGPLLAGTGAALVWDMLTAGSYFVEGYDSTGLPCGNYFSNTLHIGQTPTVALGNDTTVCDINTLILSGPPGNGYAYAWMRLPNDIIGQSQYLYLDYSTSGLGMNYYVLFVTDTFNCTGSDTIGVNFQICPSVEEYGSFYPLVYPNPASDYVLVEIPYYVHNGHLWLYNAQGQLLISQQIDGLKFEVATTSLSRGLYIIKLTEGGNFYYFKVVRE